MSRASNLNEKMSWAKLKQQFKKIRKDLPKEVRDKADTAIESGVRGMEYASFILAPYLPGVGGNDELRIPKH